MTISFGVDGIEAAATVRLYLLKTFIYLFFFSLTRHRYETDIDLAIIVKKTDKEWVLAFGVALDFQRVTSLDKVPAAIRLMKNINTNSLLIVFSTAKGRFTVGKFTVDTLANSLVVCFLHLFSLTHLFSHNFLD